MLQYNLVSLIPALLPCLQDAAVPEMDSLSTGRAKADSLRMSDRQSVMKFMGLPLPLFGKGAMFQPYCPLQQLDLLACDSWLIGTTNSIFKQQRRKPDVIVDVRSWPHRALHSWNSFSCSLLTPRSVAWYLLRLRTANGWMISSMSYKNRGTKRARRSHHTCNTKGAMIILGHVLKNTCSVFCLRLNSARMRGWMQAVQVDLANLATSFWHNFAKRPYSAHGTHTQTRHSTT